MKKNEFKCGMCGNVHEKGWSDEESEEEAEEIFGKHPKDWDDERVIICDDCFQKINPRENPEILEESKKYL